jgi:hypothetical protein
VSYSVVEGLILQSKCRVNRVVENSEKYLNYASRHHGQEILFSL